MESAIVTIKAQNGQFERDMELPSGLPVSELTDKLMETLRLIDYRTFGSIQNPVLVSGGKALDRNRTLDELGLWDGSIIFVR